MAEYIDREAILAKSFQVPGMFSNVVSAWDIANEPTADVKPVVRAKLVKVDGMDVCGRCMIVVPGFLAKDKLAKYCPHCGADMQEKGDN